MDNFDSETQCDEKRCKKVRYRTIGVERVYPPNARNRCASSFCCGSKGIATQLSPFMDEAMHTKSVTFVIL
uniref:AlNc14C43G3556 protein n=1 Tax=Albugo laibachii Nc14 TaxID=890382 RepID=F0WA12_9STRA|nr:AlNc14C43G3556 [Albugo laibachii Nc14]CCA27727.1 AlNc14C656G12343 [Albugo laibachii Nc14]|eukprot:CCA27727.1 AlNc14C656G12343 [Albugo laibachii Nc14]